MIHVTIGPSVTRTIREFFNRRWLGQPGSTYALSAVLAFRATFGVLFGLIFLASPRLRWAGVFERFSNCAIADGLLALCLAIGFLIVSPRVGSRLQRWALPALGLCDSLIRLGAGIAIREWPGIPYFPVTSVLFLATIGALTAWVSVVELGVL